MSRATLFIIIVFLFSSCSTGSGHAATKNDSLSIFAAASLTDAFSEIGEQYQADHPDVVIHMNFASSNSLRIQIEQGAQADIYASANTEEMDVLVRDGVIEPGSDQLFLTNSLVVVVPPDNPGRIKQLDDLKTPGLKLVLAAEEVPAGKYARQALGKLDSLYGENYSEEVLRNLSSNEENVRLVLTKVQLGEADAGIVYTSDAISAPELIRIEIPEEYNVLAKYPISRLKNASHPEAAVSFINFVLSPPGQDILKKWGFTPVHPATP